MPVRVRVSPSAPFLVQSLNVIEYFRSRELIDLHFWVHPPKVRAHSSHLIVIPKAYSQSALAPAFEAPYNPLPCCCGVEQSGSSSGS